MKATQLIAAAALYAIAGATFAANAGSAAANVASEARVEPTRDTAAPAANTQRNASRAKGAELIRTHKSSLALQLEQYKN